MDNILACCQLPQMIISIVVLIISNTYKCIYVITVTWPAFITYILSTRGAKKIYSTSDFILHNCNMQYEVAHQFTHLNDLRLL